MQYISEKWLRLFNACYVLVCFALFGVYLYFAYQQQTLLIENVPQLGISVATASFALLCILYNLLLLRIIKRSNIWLAYLISFAMFAITWSAATEVALNTSSMSIFLGVNVILALMSVSFGPVAALALLGVVGVFFAMSVSGSTTRPPYGIVTEISLVVLRVIGVTTLLFLLRNRYHTQNEASQSNYIERYFVRNEVVKLLTDSITDGILILDSKGVIKAINPGAALIFAQPQKDITDLSYKSVLKLKTIDGKDIPDGQQPVQQALSGKKTINQELSLQLKDSADKIIDINASAIGNPATGTLYGAAVILRDISKKKREEAARSEFISTASHEMRTPVAAIEGYLALALNPNVATVDEKAKGFLEKAHLSTEHLGRLFQDLLVSAKAEDGRLISHPTVIEMNTFLSQLADDLRMITAKKSLALEYVTSSGEGTREKVVQPLFYVLADPDRLREIITNLFDNAVKYTDSGKITIGLTGNEEVVQFFVKDTGAGIPTEDVPHLFQKFYRVDNRATRTTGGTGLGLFISRKILELYKGKIWVESELGKGSTFYVNLPRMSSSQITAMQSQTAAQSIQIPSEPITRP
jgi:signal transduction histidine kinase